MKIFWDILEVTKLLNRKPLVEGEQRGAYWCLEGEKEREKWCNYINLKDKIRFFFKK